MNENFTPYEHMENQYRVNPLLIDPSIKFVCTEKIHGTNYSFLVNNLDVTPCKRTSILKKNDSFFNHTFIFNKYKDEAVKVFNLIKLEYPDTQSIQLFGELFGGYYDGVKEKKYTQIQRGVNYHKENEFMAYDLKIKTDSLEFYYDFDKLTELLKQTTIKLVPVLFIGSLLDCMKLNPAFESQVYSHFGLEKITNKSENSLAEGYVIHPLKESENKLKLKQHRFIFKFKNPQFEEVHQPKIPLKLESEFKITYKLLERYMTQNRYDNVVSKLCENELSKENIKQKLYEDIIVDLKSDFEGILDDSKNKQECEKFLNIIINNFLKK